jgi:hypothetical protein
MVQFHNFVSEHLHHHTCSSMLFNKIFETHCAWMLSCFGPEVGTWLTIWLAFPTFRLFPHPSPQHFECDLDITFFNCRDLSMCVHTSHWCYRCPPLMFHPWQWAHMHSWCSSQHFCCHCIRCQLPCGMTQDSPRISTTDLLQGVNSCKREIMTCSLCYLHFCRLILFIFLFPLYIF